MKTQSAVEGNHHSVGAKKSDVTNQRTNKISKRSNVMKTTGLLRRILIVLAVLAVGVASLLGQAFKNGNKLRNTGTLTVKEFQNYKGVASGTVYNKGVITATTTGGGSGHFLNSDGTHNGTAQNYIGGAGGGAGTIVAEKNFINLTGTFVNDSTGLVPLLSVGDSLNAAGTFTTAVGKVRYSSSTHQTVRNLTYGSLELTGGQDKNFTGSTIVNDSLRISGSATLHLRAFTLNFKGTTDTVAGSGVVNFAAGTVTYSRNGDQTLIPATYGNLTTSSSSGTNVKIAHGGVALSAGGVLTVAANDTLVVTGALNLGNAGVTLANNNWIRLGGDPSFVGTIADLGNIQYYGPSGNQNVAAGTYAALRLGYASTKIFPAGVVSVTGNYTIDGGTGAGSRTYGTGGTHTFEFNPSGPITLSGLNAENFDVLQFNGTGTKTISSGTISANSVTVATNSGAVSNAATFTVNSGGLTINSNTNIVSPTWTNTAAMTITAGGFTNNAIFAQNSGLMTITLGGVNNTSTGAISVAAAGSMDVIGDFQNDGVLTNDGSITVN